MTSGYSLFILGGGDYAYVNHDGRFSTVPKARLAPIFERHRVDLHLSGHDQISNHVSARSVQSPRGTGQLIVRFDVITRIETISGRPSCRVPA